MRLHLHDMDGAFPDRQWEEGNRDEIIDILHYQAKHHTKYQGAWRFAPLQSERPPIKLRKKSRNKKSTDGLKPSTAGTFFCSKQMATIERSWVFRIDAHKRLSEDRLPLQFWQKMESRQDQTSPLSLGLLGDMFKDFLPRPKKNCSSPLAPLSFHTLSRNCARCPRDTGNHLKSLLLPHHTVTNNVYQLCRSEIENYQTKAI